MLLLLPPRLPFELWHEKKKRTRNVQRSASVSTWQRRSSSSTSEHPPEQERVFMSAWRRRRSSPARASASRLLESTRLKASRHVSLSQWKGVWTVVRGIHARSKRARALPTIERCMSASQGFPHGFPSGKSVNTKRATPHSSTISRAQPMIAVEMPFASRCRATRLTVWWQTGQSAERSTASTPSSRHHSRIWGA